MSRIRSRDTTPDLPDQKTIGIDDQVALAGFLFQPGRNGREGGKIGHSLLLNTALEVFDLAFQRGEPRRQSGQRVFQRGDLLREGVANGRCRRRFGARLVPRGTQRQGLIDMRVIDREGAVFVGFIVLVADVEHGLAVRVELHKRVLRRSKMNGKRAGACSRRPCRDQPLPMLEIAPKANGA